MPVLVGWAAAAGPLTPGAFFLLAIIFFWTPPHSWALAVRVNRDYQAGQVPMMPAAHGERWTYLKMIWYSLLLTVLTLLALPLGLFGAVFFGAVLLGLGLLWSAFRLLEQASKLAARRLYKYSSHYLGLLFLMMIDHPWTIPKGW